MFINMSDDTAKYGNAVLYKVKLNSDSKEFVIPANFKVDKKKFKVNTIRKKAFKKGLLTV